MRLVVVESPLAGDREFHKCYARLCMRAVLRDGDAPYASHLLFDQPGLLDDTKPDERELGIRAGLVWGTKADLTAVYTDLGMSPGMRRGIAAAEKLGRPVEMRQLPADLMLELPPRTQTVEAPLSPCGMEAPAGVSTAASMESPAAPFSALGEITAGFTATATAFEAAAVQMLRTARDSNDIEQAQTIFELCKVQCAAAQRIRTAVNRLIALCAAPSAAPKD